jgi:predicted nuclease of restriction endonuclease-like (RecB) superfamily
LLSAIESANKQCVGRAVAAVNQALVIRNWLVGAYIVEYEQGGADRAKYGARLLERLAVDLAGRGLKALNLTLLKLCRSAYQVYPQIGPTLSVQFGTGRGPIRIGPTPSDESRLAPRKRKALHAEEAPSLRADLLLRLSWSALVELLSIEDPWKRAFYENETLQGHWSVRQLRRQIESLLYERTGLSKNKTAIVRRAHGQESQESIEDLIRDPYVLEFVGLAERAEYSENDLETALLDHVQRFLLELGTGFCFEARQFRITVNAKHDRVDLVFYHRRLRCHVLLDLKIRAFRHVDAGQMNFYVNWFKAHMMAGGDQPPVGIILCSDKDHTEVEFATAGMDNRLFVSRYLTALPSAEQLKAFVERDRARLETFHAAKEKDRS